jgi:DNA mismatch repair protein MutS
MFEQYLQIKQEHPDALLFYRMGDFYELFFEDAEIAARDLNITLTSRNPGDSEPVPMCGVPHHAAAGYLAKLMDKGRKVAICDQIEDPKQAKGLVKRAVTRILTPGSVVEDDSLNPKANNYLAALLWNAEKGAGALAWIDYSTGEWTGFASSKEPQLWQWLAKINPSEILLSDVKRVPGQYADLKPRVSVVPEAFFDRRGAQEKLLAAQGTADLSTLDLADKPWLVATCGALLSYLTQTQKSDLGHLLPFQPLDIGRHLILDEVSERNLEIFRRLDGSTGRGTLFHVLDRTMTPMGGRLLGDRLRKPWRDVGPVEAAQEAVGFFHADEFLRHDVRDFLDQVYDLERLSTRIFLGRTTPKDMVALRASLAVLPGLRTRVMEAEANPPRAVAEILAMWDDMEDIFELLANAFVENPPMVVTEGGIFRHGYDEDLDELLGLTEHGEARLAELLAKEQAAHELPKLRLGSNKVFGYYFELSRAYTGSVPAHFERRQTLVNAERFITPELKELEEKLMTAAERRKNLEYELFTRLRDTLARARSRFMNMARVLAELDVAQSLADVAARAEWVRPVVAADFDVDIKAGRHPVIEAVQGRDSFIPNDVRLDEGGRIMLITGPNMAGKSTVLRQTAVIAILAQIGSFVPATTAKIGLADRVFCRVGASDNLAFGQSTFMVEMTETARILRQASRRSLVILDEIGRGTSTFDGLALAWAIAEALATRAGQPIRTLFATHYHELTALEGTLPGVRNFTIAIKEYKGEIIFMRRLIPGPSDRSYGIEVAKLAGVPRPVVTRAKEVLKMLEDARDSGPSSSAAVTARQTLLPGLEPTPRPDTAQAACEHPVLDEMRALSLDNLTPLSALNLLQAWKERLDKE